MKRSSASFCVFFLALILAAPLPCRAQRFALQPVGNGGAVRAVPIKLKSINAEVVIRGQFAATTLNLVFHNETRSRMEADFLMKLPPHAIPTSFAYWFGKEKIVARIAEKERAAALYRAITTPPVPRDPALVELMGNNTLRARIFPVEANADLKVEMRLIQVLPSHKGEAVYEFPLAPAKAGTGTLESLKINITLTPDSGFARLSNNFNIPTKRDAKGVLRLRLERKNFRPTRDWRIALVHRPQTLRASFLAARSNGSDGFFALALTPSRAMRNPKFSIAGLKNYDVLPVKIPSLRAGQVLIICGKYRGVGNAIIALQDRRAKLQSTLRFTSRRDAENLAGKLWAARKIESLSHAKAKTNLSTRRRVVAMSTQFGLPSRFTTWLAVPASELANFKEEKAEIDLTFYARQISLLIRNNQSQSADANDLKARFYGAAKEAGRDPKPELKYRLGNIVYDLQDQIAKEKTKGRKASARKIGVLNRDVQALLKAGALNDKIVRRDIYNVEGKLLLTRQELEKTGDAAATQKLRAREKVLATRYSELLNAPAPPGQWGGGGGFRSGDPLLQVQAPADAIRVVAVFPDNSTRSLSFDLASQSWQMRFDIPTYYDEGEYSVSVIIVLQNGQRRTSRFSYRVDLTPPKADDETKIMGVSTPVLRLDLTTDGATRVEAILPWNEKIALQPAQLKANSFFAAVPVPAEYSGKKFEVTYIVTDAAHNRTQLSAEVSP